MKPDDYSALRVAGETRHLAILADRGATRSWIGRLAETLAREPGLAVTLHPAGRRPGVLSRLDLLQDLERMVLRARPRGSVLVPLQQSAPARETHPASLVLDLRSDCARDPDAALVPADALLVRPLYDGHAGEEQLAACLLAGHAPRVDLVEVRSGAVLWSGRPSIEAARSVTEALEAVSARTATMLHALAVAPRASVKAAAGPARRLGAPLVARHLGKRLASLVARALYHAACQAPHWRVGWRLVEGPGVAERLDLSGPAWQTLPDPGTRFYADPFPLVRDGRRHLFVEDLDHRTGKGIVSVVEIDESGPRGLPIPVLEEPWHLSYPFLLEHEGEVYMIPESSTANAVHLYRADPYPTRWVREATLVEGACLSDATLVREGGRWYMLATEHDGVGAHSDMLVVHHAPDLFGPWTRLSREPVLIDAETARPAGAFVRGPHGLLRPVQDCAGGYGRALGLAAITRLDEEGFSQRLVARIAPGPAWPGRRLHTLNRAGDLECIDGSALSLRGWGTVAHA
ncbi:glucosamine inositolphosphorylceramide transferase family protein [Salinarimonas ramus]|uniref:Glucosamine inositolphosphorylceramide transferase 1 N-terminal domain-containing protein n=1 Tax=Salinarimonas ramus TaxID=690164 RepID=A0A917V3Z7_9HYPH|nr:hypothetical protein [Salinarimonas ramus]GGK34059.1 hypothetical protein GCM10011322_20940 [Salinarimonas ramus]